MRNQEWRVLIIIVGVVYAFFKVDQNTDLLILIATMGIIACGFGIHLTITHWKIFFSKMKVIDACEKELGIKAEFYNSIFSVQGTILLMYFFLTCIFSGIIIWLISQNFLLSVLLSLILFIAGFFLSFKCKRYVKNRIDHIPSPKFGIKKNQ